MSSAVSGPIKPVATIFCSAGSVILTSLCRSGVVRCRCSHSYADWGTGVFDPDGRAVPSVVVTAGHGAAG